MAKAAAAKVAANAAVYPIRRMLEGKVYKAQAMANQRNARKTTKANKSTKNQNINNSRNYVSKSTKYL